MLTFRKNSRSLLNPKAASEPNSRHHVGQRNAQGSGQPFDVDERDIAIAALDAADVSAVEAGQIGKPLLRDSLVQPQFP